MGKSAIQWTDATDNIIVVKGGGWWCRKISEGCDHCYAARLNQSDYFHGNHLEYKGEVPYGLILKTDIIDGWKRQSKPKKHFVASMTDIFGEWVPKEWTFRFLEGMVEAPNQTFQLLTKRPRIMADHVSEFIEAREINVLPKNIQCGTSVENQKWADIRIPQLLAVKAQVRFLSVEPMLGEVDIISSLPPPEPNKPFRPGEGWKHKIQWVICGGESGPGSRPMHPDWVRDLRDQCVAAGVAYFFKQWGEYEYGEKIPTQIPGQNSYVMNRVGKKRSGRLLDGREWNEFPDFSGVSNELKTV